MRELPEILRRHPAMGTLARPVLSRPARPGGGVTAFLTASALALVAGVPLRSAHRLLPEPED
jgi:hypothetical protein